MKIGKLNWDDLKSIIDKKTVKRKEVRVRSDIGEDCSVIGFGDYECVISTDPITGAAENIGRLAVHINCNDIASCGVEPLGIFVTILAPSSSTLDDIKKVMEDIDAETSKLNVEILGGHTEVTDAVNKMVLSCTVIGKSKYGEAISTASAKVEDDIIVTKSLGLEGTSILVNDYYGKSKLALNDAEIKEAKSYIDNISVVKEGVLCGKQNVNSMHDITEGGVLGALWEVAKASKVGFEVYKDKMPISNITRKLGDLFNIDILKFISSGSMLITCKNGDEIVRILNDNGIEATLIGKITNEKGILIDGDKNLEVAPPEVDELFKIS